MSNEDICAFEMDCSERGTDEAFCNALPGCTWKNGDCSGCVDEAHKKNDRLFRAELKLSLGGRRVRSNKGKKRGAYGPRTGKTRSGRRFRRVSNRTRKVGRKTRSNKGKKRGPYGPRTGKTR